MLKIQQLFDCLTKQFTQQKIHLSLLVALGTSKKNIEAAGAAKAKLVAIDGISLNKKASCVIFK